jgi:DNA-binding MarR family transcriptional regulator
VYRSDEDIQLLGELAGVLDQTVAARGLSAGTYLVLRELSRAEGGAPRPISSLAESLGADGDEVAALVQRLVQDELARVRPNGAAITEVGRQRVAVLEDEANDAIRAYVVDRPHTATVYGLVASMRAGRFTVEDLIAFISEGPGPSEEEDAGEA